MLENITIIEGKSVRAIEWLGDAREYDLALFALGQDLDSFIVLNPWIDNSARHYIDTIPETDQCVIWNYQGQWVAKYFNQEWTPRKGYVQIELEQTQMMWNQNPAFAKKLKFKNDPTSKFTVDPWDSRYKLTWYVDDDYNPTDDKVWAITATPVGRSVAGIKDMGYLTPVTPKKLDVIFISYDETNAEENWQRVLEKAPWAKRVDGVTGILEAHKAAAKLAKTDMFYVVDGDAYLVDEWQFDFEPDIFNRDCSYVWNSRNPVNDLIYENGGVKLFPKKLLLKTRKWATLDMFTGVTDKIKIMDSISNITTFNTTKFSSWRSAFRECVKLYTVNQMTKLNTWLTKGKEDSFSQYTMAGAAAGCQYAIDNKDNPTALANINNYIWLKEQFMLHYKEKNERKNI